MISLREKEIIIGTILGDGHVNMLKTDARLELCHSELQKDYLFWKYKELKSFVLTEPRRIEFIDKRNGKSYSQWRFRTRIDRIFTKFHDIFYLGKRKVIPHSLAQLIKSPLILAVWFMDDGGRRNDCYGLFLNSLSFSKIENELLKQCLRRNFSLNSRIHWVQDGYRLYIPSKDAKRFCELIYPYIIPSMRYKLSYNPVTTSFARLDRARDRSIKTSIIRQPESF